MVRSKSTLKPVPRIETPSEQLKLRLELRELRIVVFRTAAALSIMRTVLEGDAEDVKTKDKGTLESIQDQMYGQVHLLDVLSAELERAAGD